MKARMSTRKKFAAFGFAEKERMNELIERLELDCNSLNAIQRSIIAEHSELSSVLETVQKDIWKAIECLEYVETN